MTLQQAREAAGLSRAELARLAKVGAETVRRAEACGAVPRWRTARQLAGALGATPAQIREWAEAGK